MDDALLSEVEDLLLRAQRAARKLRVSRMRGEGGVALYRFEFDELVAAADRLAAARRAICAARKEST